MRHKLIRYIPEAAADDVIIWLNKYAVFLRVSRKRAGKLGDYRPPHEGMGHRISVNGNLNPYAFLITLVHELAHLLTWEKHKNKVRPHGEAWKAEFRFLMQPLFEKNIFPVNVAEALRHYMQNPRASSCTDIGLQRMLRQYDRPGQTFITVEELESGSIFTLATGRIFEKGERLRKRYKCRDLHNGRYYMVHPLAEVHEMKKP